jgi:hypothetical protein
VFSIAKTSDQVRKGSSNCLASVAGLAPVGNDNRTRKKGTDNDATRNPGACVWNQTIPSAARNWP